MFHRFYRRGESGYMALLILMLFLFSAIDSAAYSKSDFRNGFEAKIASNFVQTTISQDVIPLMVDMYGTPHTHINVEAISVVFSVGFPEGPNGQNRWEGKQSPKTSSLSSYSSTYYILSELNNIEIHQYLDHIQLY